jgi:hypothetical protein
MKARWASPALPCLLAALFVGACDDDPDDSARPPILADDDRGGLKLLRPEVLADVLENSFGYRYANIVQLNVDTFTTGNERVYLGGVDYTNVTVRAEDVVLTAPLVLRRFAFQYCEFATLRTNDGSEEFRKRAWADPEYDLDTTTPELDLNWDRDGDGTQDATIPVSSWHTYETEAAAIGHFVDRLYMLIRSRPITTDVHDEAYAIFEDIDRRGACQSELDTGATFASSTYCDPSWEGDADGDGVHDALVDTGGMYPWLSVCAYFMLIDGSFAVY